MATKKVTENETPRMSEDFTLSMENCVDDMQYYSETLNKIIGAAEDHLDNLKFNKDTKTARQKMSVVLKEMSILKNQVERTMVQIIDAYDILRYLRDECKK
jgi:hypothetical protein